MNSIVGGSRMWSERRGLWISMGSDFIRGPCAQLSSSLFASARVEEWIFKASWPCSVIFQTATLTWVRLSVLSSVGTSCAHREWCGGLEDTGEGLTNGPKGNNNLAGLEEEGAMSSAGTPNSRASRGSAVHC